VAVAAALIIGLLVTPAAAAGKVTNWTGTASSDFADASNWDNGVPGAGDTANITSATAPSAPTITGGAVSLAQLNVDSGLTVTVSAGTLTISSGAAVNNGILDASDSGTIDLTGSGTSITSASGGGQLEVGTGATFEFTGSGDADVDVPVQIAGTMLESGNGGEIVLADPGQTNLISGVVRAVGGAIGLSGGNNITTLLDGDATFDSHAGGSISIYLNTAALDFDGHTLNLDGNFDMSDGRIQGSGRIACAAGADCATSRFIFEAPGAHDGPVLSGSGTLTVAHGAVVQQDSGTTVSGTRLVDVHGTWDLGSLLGDGGGSTDRFDLESDGTLQSGSAYAAVSGPATLDGLLLAPTNTKLTVGGAVTDEFGGTLRATGGAIDLSSTNPSPSAYALDGDTVLETTGGGTLSIGKPVALNGHTLELSGANISFSGLTGDGSVSPALGTDSASWVYDGGSLGSSGTLTLRAGLTTILDANQSDSFEDGTRTVINDGTIELPNGQQLVGDGSSELINNGTLERAGTIGNSLVELPELTNDGTINVVGGDLQFDGTLTNLSGNSLTGGTYEASAGGTLLIEYSPDVTRLGPGTTIVEDGSDASVELSGGGAATRLASIADGALLEFAGGHSETDSAPITIDGSVILDGSTLAALNGATIGPDGSISGTGILDGALTSFGAVIPGGGPTGLTVTETFDLRPGGRLEISIAGTATADVPTLHVGLDTTINGTLVIQPSSAYAENAMPGDSFTVVKYGGIRSSEFAATTVDPPLAGANGVDVVYDDPRKDVLVEVGVRPTRQRLPAVTGAHVVGSSLTATAGTWSGAPVFFAYRWVRCDRVGAQCSEVPGAAGHSYKLTGADDGHAVRAIVTATNRFGSSSATSRPTHVVTPAAGVSLRSSVRRSHPGARIKITVINGLDSSLAYRPCLDLERRDNGNWRPLRSGDHPGDCKAHASVLKPHGRHTLRVQLPKHLRSGVYRVILRFMLGRHKEQATATLALS
jgi:hypothetical protein